jgi:hypothetical protein
VKTVKRALVTAFCLLSVGIVAAESVMVTTVKPLESSRHVRIVVILNGKPVKGVKVDFCKTPGGQICFSVMTGDDGIAAPRVLPLGNYAVVAMIEDSVNAGLYLHVSRKGKVTSFPMDLTESSQASQAVMAAAEKLPIREHVRDFQGLLQDPSGALISGVSVKVVRKGSEDKTDTLVLKSDVNGRFSAQLGDGMYIAFSPSQDFAPKQCPSRFRHKGKKKC